MPRRSFFFLGAAALTLLGLSAAVLFVLPAAFAVAASAQTEQAFGAETFSPSNSSVSVVRDSAANGGKAMRWTADGTATLTGVALNESDQIRVVARGPAAGGSRAQLEVKLDGATIMDQNLRSNTYESYPVTKPVAAGKHTLAIRGENVTPKRAMFADVYVVRNAAPAPAPAPAAAPAPACDRTAAPGASVEAFANSLADGQVGCLPGGTYTEGDSVAKITNPAATRKTLMSVPGQTARINATVNVSAPNWTLKDLRMDGSYGQVCGGSETCAVKPSPMVFADNVRIVDNEITNRRPGMESTRAGICVHLKGTSTDRLTGARVTGNDIHHCGRIPRYEPGLDHAVYLSYTDGAYIADNEMWNQTDKGINLRLDADNNIIEKNIMDSNGVGVMFAGAPDSDGNIVRNNIIANSNHRFNLESCCSNDTAPNNLVENNCVWNGKLGNYGSGGAPLGFTYQNQGNIVANPGYAGNGDFTLPQNSPCRAVYPGG